MEDGERISHIFLDNPVELKAVVKHYEISIYFVAWVCRRDRCEC